MEKSGLKAGKIFIYSIATLLLACLVFNAGGVVFIGPLILSLAPDLLLLAAAGMMTSIVAVFIKRRLIVWAIFVLIVLALGLNTRILDFVHDMSVEWKSEQYGKRQFVKLSQPIKLKYDGKAISARRFPYDSARPSCYGDGCFITRGFHTPLPHIASDYWSESPRTTVLEAGFTLAKPDERAPTLEVVASETSEFATVNLRLLSEDGRLISSAKYTYRSRFLFEPVDDSRSVDYLGAAPELQRNFLLHGNIINRLLGAVAADVTPDPVHYFLLSSFTVQSAAAQDGEGQLIGVEVLDEKNYEPALEFKGKDREYPVTPWSEKAFDEERAKYCDTLLRKKSPDAIGGMVQVWWVFFQDDTGRKKMRRTGHVLCEENAVWTIDYGAKHPNVAITKYSAQGDLQYQMLVQSPPEIYGYSGSIQTKTFHERDGYLYFEWIYREQSGYDLYVRKTMNLRVALPR